MKDTVNFSRFVDGFCNRKENFTYEGLQALFNYFEEYEDSTGVEIEFDPIGIICEYIQFEDLADYNRQYADKAESLEDIRKKTEVIEIEGSDSFIICQY